VVVVSRVDLDDRPICDFCGGFIDEPYRRCPAREQGICWP
jgi:hypothetical protein